MPPSVSRVPDNDFVFMQDSAPSHRAKTTQNFLRDNTPDFSQKSYIAVEKAFSSCGKAEWRTYSAHFLLIS